MRETQIFRFFYCSRSQIRILHIAEFLLIRVIIILFLFDLIELLFGRVREEQLRLCGEILQLKKKNYLLFQFFSN